MNVSIIGTGHVGGTLGKCWAQCGHSITFGSRNPNSDHVQELVHKAGANTRAVSINQAVASSQLVVLALPWNAVEGILANAGDLTGKILIDTINIYPESGEISCAEQIAGWAKGARVIKAFNITGTGNMDYPVYNGQKLTMFICGNDSEAKSRVSMLIEELGFEVVDTGGLEIAILLESLGRLWIHLAYQRGLGKDIGYKLLKR